MANRPAYRRVLLKVSGELLAGAGDRAIDPDTIGRFAAEIAEVRGLGVQTAIVLGGGNIFRGLAGAARGMDRVQADWMGMLATVINSLALQDALERSGCPTRVMSAIAMDGVCEPYVRRRAVHHVQQGRVVVFAAGTGSPYFSTDTAAALRAAEVGADVVLKATKVDGVYDADPAVHAGARRFESLSYLDLLKLGLKVMDSTAASLCMDNSIPIVVFDASVPGNIRRAVCGEPVGTRVSAGPD